MKKQLLTLIALAAASSVFASSYSDAQSTAKKEEKARNYEVAATSWETAASAAEKPQDKCYAYFRAGECMRLKHDIVKAQEYFQKMAEVKDASEADKERAHERIAQCFIWRKKFDDAIYYCNKIISSSDISPRVKAKMYLCLGEVYKNQKKYDESISECKKVIDIDSIHPRLKGQAYYNIAFCLRAQRKYTEANEALAENINLMGENFTAQLYMAHNLSALGKNEEAIAAYEKLKILEGNSQDYIAVADLSIAGIYYKMKEYDRSKAAYEKVVANKKAGAGRINKANQMLEKLKSLTSK